MKRKLSLFIIILGAGIITTFSACKKAQMKDYPFQPIAFTEVGIHDAFWLPRLETNQKVTIPYAFEQCEETGRVDNFRIAGGLKDGNFRTRYPFDDSDVYKIIEGAAYSLHIQANPELDTYVDDLIEIIAAAQEEDGYLYTARTIKSDKPVMWTEGGRWSNLYMGHELYNMGHLYEAAAAHYLATGKRSLLDIALKNADLIDSVFGPEKKRGAPGHQVIEVGLVKLYRITGEKRYLDLAKFFLDERGNPADRKLYGEYSQDHKPVIEQSEAVGHAVRAVYMYAGMADVASLTDDIQYVQAIDRIWEDVITGKIYITGGIGATGAWEGFGEKYKLPNASAYAETCAAIGNVFWNHRQFLLHGDAKYIDVLERTLYNGLISGVSLEGTLFFYPNPLASFGERTRSPWFTCACCPSNISRFMPSVPGYVYAVRDNSVYVNLFIESDVDVDLESGKVHLAQTTDYPWDGRVKIAVEPEKEKAAEFTLSLRIPGWARNQPIPSDLYTYLDEFAEEPSINVNGEEQPLALENGYVHILRNWQKGNTVEINLPMPVRQIISHPEVEDNQGLVALQRGPIVFCAEWPDNNGHVFNLVLPDENELKAEFRSDLLNGVVVITGEALALAEGEDGKTIKETLQPFTAIPYYAWAHRGPGEMAVWIAREKDKARPLPRPTLASQSGVTASDEKNATSVNDLWDPKDSNDHSHPYLHWWPEKGTVEWVQYEFKQPAVVREVEVYWFDDTGRGECRIPANWTLFYLSGNEWKPVKALDPYGTEKDQYNRVRFDPVKTSALKLEIQLQEKYSAGVLEWKVK
ncbi:MAG: glycoside hydrolase family 127 protein [Candidatus Aminicenantes bacterium]|nr:glycoside hydrolase family 127 protein [Candidatus Aminicenantes bacterium]